MKKSCLFFTLLGLLVCYGCATVTVTKTAKGYYAPTDPDEVEILITIPNREYVELATVTTKNWPTFTTAKMHNSLRAKCAPLGAHAVILASSGIDNQGYYWSSGVAIRYKVDPLTETIKKKENVDISPESSTEMQKENDTRKIVGYRAKKDTKTGEYKTYPVYENEKK